MKIIIGLFLLIINYIASIKKKIKLLYILILNLSIIELLFNFIKYNNSSKQNIILFQIALFIILLCKKLITSEKISEKELMALIIKTSLNDTFQELVGKLFGKTKITTISPNKTLEGYLGGIISLIIINKITFKKKNKYIFMINLSNVLGDLFFSYIKRKYGIKDYSKILMDHGGLLDRYDSLIFGIIMHFFYKKYN